MLLDRTLYVKPDGEIPFILPLSFISVQVWSVLPHINEIYQWLINKLLAALLAILSYDYLNHVIILLSLSLRIIFENWYYWDGQ